MEKNQNKKPDGQKPEENRPKNIWSAVIIALALVLLFSWVYNTVSNSQYTETNFSDFIQAWEDRNLSEVEIQSDRVIYMTREEAANILYQTVQMKNTGMGVFTE